MGVELNVVPPNQTEQYYDTIQTLIETHLDEFVLWQDYITESGEPDMAFFENYRYDDAYFIMAKDDNEVVGFIVIQRDQYREDYPVQTPFTMIALSLVKKSYRGQGIASDLNAKMLELEREANTKRICRSTWAENIVQINIYEKFGFKLIGRQPNHREDGTASLYYGRPLNDSDSFVDYSLEKIDYEL